ncbi:MAG: glyoxalase [Thermoplasmatales archaeon]|nr:glyoxalase [Thermoplasmatales archaeon]
MPLGDPKGGHFVYGERGLPKNIVSAYIPSRDPEKASRFYVEILGMAATHSSPDAVVLTREGMRLVLKKSDVVGVDTGIVFGVDSPFDLHRRLVDEGVVFTREPTRGPIGVQTSFRDDDGNVLHASDIGGQGIWD